MRPVKPSIQTVEFLRKDHDVSVVCLGDEGDAFDVDEISGSRQPVLP